MKEKFIFLVVLIACSVINSQTLEQKLNKVTDKIVNDFKKYNNIYVAVYPFTSLKKNENDLSMHMLGEFHSALTLKANNVKVMDRETLDSYLAEHQLKSEALIDKNTAKEFGKLIAVDGYITGKIYKFGSVLNFQVKVTDTQTGEVLSYTSEKIPIDYDMAEFLGIEDWKDKKEKAQENKSQNSNCSRLNLGDYCFFNNTHMKSNVVLQSNDRRYKKELILPVNSKICFKDLIAGSYFYTISRIDRLNIVTQSNVLSKGYISVNTCESNIQKIDNKKRISTRSSLVYKVNIVNKNMYPRKLIFINQKGEEAYLSIGANTTSSIELPKGIYKFISQTTFTKTIVQRSSFSLRGNKLIHLSKDHFN